MEVGQCQRGRACLEGRRDSGLYSLRCFAYTFNDVLSLMFYRSLLIRAVRTRYQDITAKVTPCTTQCSAIANARALADRDMIQNHASMSRTHQKHCPQLRALRSHPECTHARSMVLEAAWQPTTSAYIDQCRAVLPPSFDIVLVCGNLRSPAADSSESFLPRAILLQSLSTSSCRFHEGS